MGLFRLGGIGSNAVICGATAACAFAATIAWAACRAAERDAAVSDAGLARSQIDFVRTLDQGCRVVASRKRVLATGSFAPEHVSLNGDPFLLFAYSRLYEQTGDSEYLATARRQRRCVADTLGTRSSSPAGFADFAMRIVALAEFSRVSGEASAVDAASMRRISSAKFDETPLPVRAQLEIRRARALVYAAHAGEHSTLETAGNILVGLIATFDTPAVFGASEPYILAKLLRALCELSLANGGPADVTSASAIETLRSRLDGRLGKLLDPNSYSVLIHYQAALAADTCLAAGQDGGFGSLLDHAINVLAASIEPGGGIVEMANRQTVSLNAETAWLLLRHADRLSR